MYVLCIQIKKGTRKFSSLKIKSIPRGCITKKVICLQWKAIKKLSNCVLSCVNYISIFWKRCEILFLRKRLYSNTSIKIIKWHRNSCKEICFSSTKEMCYHINIPSLFNDLKSNIVTSNLRVSIVLSKKQNLSLKIFIRHGKTFNSIENIFWSMGKIIMGKISESNLWPNYLSENW